MEFGKTLDIENIPWNLPPEDPQSLTYIQKLPGPGGRTEFYVGTPAWGHKEWVGKIYPPKTKATEYLRYYAKNFNTIELNTSHYRIPSAEQVKKWVDQVPANFLFCPKLYQSISHSDSGLLDRGLLKEWFFFLENLKDHRGPCFAQFPPHFSYAHKAVLFHFLKQWPEEFNLALEFRHPSWFQDGRVIPALTEYLQSRGIGLVITDVAGRRDVLHTSISAPFVMLRFIGNNLHESDFTRAKAWVRRLGPWSQAGLKQVYFFVHEPDDINAPEMANVVVRELSEECGADLEPLKWVLP